MSASPHRKYRLARYVDSGYPLTIQILTTLLMVILPLSAVSDVAARTHVALWQLIALAALSIGSLLVVHSIGMARRRTSQQLGCLALQCASIGVMQLVMPSPIIGYLFLCAVLQAVYLFGIWIAVLVAIPVWVAWGGTAIVVTRDWMEWLGSNIYAIFLIVAVIMAGAFYTAQYRLKAQIDSLLQRLQAQRTDAATPEQIQQAATMEERHRLIHSMSDELWAGLGRLEHTLNGAIAQAQASVAHTKPLLLQTQTYVRETVDSLRATLKTLRPPPGSDDAVNATTLHRDTTVPDIALSSVSLATPRTRLVLEWLPLAFCCLIPFWVAIDQRLAPLASGEMLILCLMMVACYLYTRWSWSSPWFQLGLAGQACTLLMIVFVTQSSALLIGLAVIAGQLALRCNWIQLVAGLLALQGAVGIVVSMINPAPWQIVASLLLVGVVGTALVFPILSARRRFDQRMTAAVLLHALSEEIATLNQRATTLRQVAVVAERQRIAREMHDGLGHYLMTIALQICVAQELLDDDPPAALRQLYATQGLIGEARQQFTASFDALHPLSLSGGSLQESLALLVQRHTECGGRVMQMQYEGSVDALPNEVALALFRAAQEGISNAVRHGCATYINITLTHWPSLVRLVVENDSNNGCAPATQGGMGLSGLRERAALLGGICESTAHPAGSFTLLFEIPIPWAQL